MAVALSWARDLESKPDSSAHVASLPLLRCPLASSQKYSSAAVRAYRCKLSISWSPRVIVGPERSSGNNSTATGTTSPSSHDLTWSNPNLYSRFRRSSPDKRLVNTGSIELGISTPAVRALIRNAFGFTSLK